jgi:CHAD domain-containing protein
VRTYDAIDVRPVGRFIEAHAGASGFDVLPAGGDRWEATYWDTEDWRLLRAGLELRVRRSTAELMPLDRDDDAGKILATESLTGSPAGLPDQEGPVAERVRALVAGRPLAARVRVTSELQQIRLVPHDGSAAVPLIFETLTIPVGRETPPARAARVHVQGEGGPAFDEFWSTVARTCGLRPVRDTRFNTARIALGIEMPGVPEIGPEDVTADGSVADVAYAVLRRHFRTALRHEPGTRLGDDFEELHDMRVSVRRMRSVMKLFRGYLPRRLLGLRPHLGWVGRVLGEVRDLDVQIERLDEWRSMLDARDRPALDAIEGRLRRLRDRSRRRMLRALDTRRYARIMERTAAALSRTSRTPPVSREPILHHAPRLIQESWERVIRSGRKITPDAKPEVYHRLRIHCKSLRYALETHAPLYGKPVRKMIRRLVVLQDLLGEHQDSYVAVDQLRELVEKGRLPAATIFAMGVLAGIYRNRAVELRRGFPETFQAVGDKRWRNLQRSMQKLAYATIPTSDRPERPCQDPPKPRSP